eukprot:TRINITY_DN10639_c0_g1_i1.p1 TRINITY_DN10639_c0_g1~~TRINITY_DN10639_c0_g1_i1.p1  ORF type:complete len:215 (-),score=50.01 TRINITY_DN10639_c0_g1_i1:1183-1827(-)
MVFWMTITNEEKGEKYQVFMGKDKFENEDLIKYGWPEDVWFHVSELSSAHVYLRLPSGMSIDSIPDDIVKKLAILVKFNSIEGCKKPRVRVCYTMWSNLLKRQSMEVGQVSFHDEKAVKYIEADKDNTIAHAILKTKVEKSATDFKEQREAYDQKKRDSEKKYKKQQAEAEKKLREERAKEKELRSYTNVMKPENMKSNADQKLSAEEYEDNFM